MKSILFVDDEIKLLKILSAFFRKKGYTIYIAANGEEARKTIKEKEIDIVFLDLKLPDTTGLKLLEEFIPLYPHKIFIIMTAYSEVESAVTAMKAGAFDYLAKPVKMNEIQVVIEKASTWLGMKQENIHLKEKLKEFESQNGIIGVSLAMKQIFQMVERVAATDATLLLHGESGTGKSMIARMVHKLSNRNEEPFIAVNCAAIPEQLLESELFGFEKGAFTGANVSREGKFEAANGGTIFLDEIGEVSLPLQSKLLQVVQEKSFMRLGSNKTKQVDVRIISATNRDLKKMVQEGAFREDLYYRLNIVDIYIPSLKDRKDDIPIFIEGFLQKYRKKYNKNFQVSPQLMNNLSSYYWPGNVRELENALERAVVLCRGENLSLEDFPREIQKNKQTTLKNEQFPTDPNKSLPQRMEEIERRIILAALEENHGNAAEAARKLGVSRQRLLYKLNKYFVQ